MTSETSVRQASNVSPSTTVWCICLGKQALENVEIARERGTWGAMERKALEQIAEGDLVVFVVGLTSVRGPKASGFPRLDSQTFPEVVNEAKEVVLVEVTSDIHQDESHVWSDDTYPWRFRFEELGSAHDVSIPDTLSSEQIEVLRMCAIQGGTARRLPGRIESLTGVIESGPEMEDRSAEMDNRRSAEHPMHIFIRFTSEFQAEDGTVFGTVEEHRDALREHGEVWWGSFGRGIGTHTLQTIRGQLSSGVETRVYLYEQETYRWYIARLKDVVDEKPEDASRVPSYYRDQDCAVYLKLTGIDGPVLTQRARPIQNPLLYVYEDGGQDPEHLRLVSNDRGLLELEQEGSAGPDLVDFKPPEIVKQFREALEPTGFRYRSSLLQGFICSCITKPFVILTGNSGTGKSKLAQLFARWLVGEEGYAFVPVGADWTDNRNILGFFNPMRGPEDDNPGLYQTTPVLDLVLDASRAPDRPFFLILDEMNLSHVERYFSDFLSAMESGEPVPIHSEPGEVRASSDTDSTIPQRLEIPPNLFVIGTVNVDETTYMFSPKVLDRANVIEFGVSRQELGEFVGGLRSWTDDIGMAAGGHLAGGFLALSRTARGLGQEGDSTSLPEPPWWDDAVEALLDVFEILAHQGLEFAFRPTREALRYLLVHDKLTGEEPRADTADSEQTIGEREEDSNGDHKQSPLPSGGRSPVDAQIVQKLLPKLHGSRRRLEPLLVALAIYCRDGKLDEAKAYLNQTGQREPVDLKEVEEPLFPRSYRKLRTMVQTVQRDQFVSFIQ